MRDYSFRWLKTCAITAVSCARWAGLWYYDWRRCMDSTRRAETRAIRLLCRISRARLSHNSWWLLNDPRRSLNGPLAYNCSLNGWTDCSNWNDRTRNKPAIYEAGTPKPNRAANSGRGTETATNARRDEAAGRGETTVQTNRSAQTARCNIPTVISTSCAETAANNWPRTITCI